MKTKRLLLSLGAALCLCSLSLSPILAQTNKQVTPGTFSHLPTQISPSANGVGLGEFYSSTGHYTISSDGIGSLDASMNIRVNKPNAQATVEKAILISAVTFTTITDGCVTLNGVPVNWDGTAAVSVFNNYWADVTSIVASTINAFPAGISTLPITECNSNNIDGEALLVVFNDPSAAEKTIIVLLGAEDPQGDNFSVTLAKPIDPNEPGALLDMGLGIGFSYQLNGVNQASQVSVNDQRVSSSAGGEDDGASANGALLTVGGIGDVNDNPSDPNAPPTNPRSDDELYNILPFISASTTSLTVNTINPSLDDNIFLAYFVTSEPSVVGEGILLSQASDTGNVGDNHTVEATIVDDNGMPIPDKVVTFTVTAGPNAGNTFTATTNASGNASYTYTGTGGSGTDSVQACFTDNQNQTICSNILPFVWITGGGGDDSSNICLRDNFHYRWQLRYLREGKVRNAHGYVVLGEGVTWEAYGYFNYENGKIELHAINPNADGCASGMTDSFMYKGNGGGYYDHNNNGNPFFGASGNWKSYCSGSVFQTGTFSLVDCDHESQVPQLNNFNKTPARSGTNNMLSLKVSPNPTRGSTTISYSVSQTGKVSLMIYDYLMQPIKMLANDVKTKGNYTITWDGKKSNGTDVLPGVYKAVAIINGKSYSTSIQIAR